LQDRCCTSFEPWQPVNGYWVVTRGTLYAD